MAQINNHAFPYDITANSNRRFPGIDGSDNFSVVDDRMRLLMANTRIALNVLYANSVAINTDIETMMANGWVNTARIADDAITAPKIASNAIITDKVADDAITGPKIANNAVSSNQIANNAVRTSEIADNAITADKIASANNTNKIEVAKIGEIKLSGASATSGAWAGWLACDGRILLRDTYPALFAEIGTEYGLDDSNAITRTTTFRLPDFTDAVPRQATRGEVSGGTATLEPENLADHKHLLFAENATSSPSTPSPSATEQVARAYTGASNTAYGLRLSTEEAAVGLSSDPTGDTGEPFEVVPRRLGVNYMIFTGVY